MRQNYSYREKGFWILYIFFWRGGIVLQLQTRIMLRKHCSFFCANYLEENSLYSTPNYRIIVPRHNNCLSLIVNCFKKKHFKFFKTLIFLILLLIYQTKSIIADKHGKHANISHFYVLISRKGALQLKSIILGKKC